MRAGGGFLLVFVGLLLLWVAVTGRLDKLVAAIHAIVSDDKPADAANGIPALPALPKLGGA